MYIFLIIVIFTAAGVETDIFLPAMAEMMAHFAVSEAEIQSLLTWNFVGICLTGPLYGPLSDAWGRKKPLLTALGLFALGSMCTLVASSFSWMLLGRLLQGVGSGGCMTLGTAIIFDVFKKDEAIHALSRINSIFPFIACLAPLLGGYLTYAYGFRSNFVAIATLVAICLLICALYFKEPLAKEARRGLDVAKITRDFKEALTHSRFWQHTIVVSLLFTGYLVFLSMTSVLFVTSFALSTALFVACQGALLGAWLVASLTSRACITAWSIPIVKIRGTWLVAVGALGLFVGAFLFPENPYLLTMCMMMYAFGANWAQGIYFPEGMELLPHIKGVTASILTSVRLLLTALILGFASKLYDGTIFPVAYVVAGTTACVLTICFQLRKSGRVADCVCLENRFTSDGDGGSNPSSSDFFNTTPH